MEMGVGRREEDEAERMEEEVGRRREMGVRSRE